MPSPKSSAKAPKIDLTSGVDDDVEPLVKLNPADVAYNAPEDPMLPGFEMSDEPLPTPDAQARIEEYAADQPVYDPKSFSDTVNARARGHQIPDAKKALDGEIIPKATPPVGSTVYESRIRILEAWQYPGSVPKTAPAYIDRNWIGWADPDPVRGREGSPCLRIPASDQPSTVVICRPGDFVVRQEVQMAPGFPSAEKVEVWEEEQFARLFIANPEASGPAGG